MRLSSSFHQADASQARASKPRARIVIIARDLVWNQLALPEVSAGLVLRVLTRRSASSHTFSRAPRLQVAIASARAPSASEFTLAGSSYAEV
eukprot:COSAG03_NODE_151_length_11504_cov_23.518632_2_plen_92_part_00